MNKSYEQQLEGAAFRDYTKRMRKQKLTPWFKGVNPLESRPGFYQCRCCKKRFYWNGYTWNYDRTGEWCAGVDEWRGVAK